MYNVYTPIALDVEIGEVDFRESEGRGQIEIVIDKAGTNMGTLVFSVTATTYDQFVGELPEELAAKDLPDPAECELHCTMTINVNAHCMGYNWGKRE